jgi:signal transduction histidine kinase
MSQTELRTDFSRLVGEARRRYGRGGALPASSATSTEPRALMPVVAPVVAGGAAAVAIAAAGFVAGGPDAGTFAAALALLLCAAISEVFPVPIEGVAVGRTSLATVFVVVAAAVEGWTVAVPVAALAMVSVEAARRRGLTRIAYNGAVYALAGLAAGGAAAALMGDDLSRLVPATLAAAAAFYAVNIGLIAAVVARSVGEPLPGVLVRYVRPTAVPFVVMGCVASVLAVVWDRSPFAALVLGPPLAAVVLYERRMHDALRRLRELDRMKDEFVAVVSHELRTPLASVYGAAMTLKRADLDDDTRESLLAIVSRESTRLATLVDQVLWASRLESDRFVAHDATTDVPRLAREVVAATKTRLPANVTLELAEAAEPLHAAADAESIEQVLVNLVDNAVKYSPDGGRIEVRVTRAGDRVRFSVRDEGLGIPPAEQQGIFEKFHRLDPNLTRGVGGTGLGLYICRGLVERMGGRIWVSSALGRGSTFTFELPRA